MTTYLIGIDPLIVVTGHGEWYNAAEMRLYWIDPNIFEREVEIKTLAGVKVTVNPVIFHPDEGGQPADKGTIGPATVCGVEVRDGRIVHTLDRPLRDGKYLARLDRAHRLSSAGQHTAQHILSGIADKQFGLKTVGVHIGLDSSTVDYDKRIDWETAMDLERQSMEVVMLDLPVETAFNETDVRIRSDTKDIEADIIRVVKIGAYDKSACCGAHLRRTGQIGIIRIIGLENKKEGTRITFLAGRTALEYGREESSVLRRLRKAAGCSTGELPEAFDKAVHRANEMAKENNQLWSQLLPNFVQTAQIVEIEGITIGIQISRIPRKCMAKLAAMIANDVGGASIVISDFNVVIHSKSMSAREILDKILALTGGKGGGSPTSANGRLDRAPTFDQMRMILKEKA